MVCSQIELNESSIIWIEVQAPLFIEDTKMVEEYILVDPQMVDGVSNSSIILKLVTSLNQIIQ